MKKIRSLHIFGKRVPVKYVKNMANKEEAHGEYDSSTGTIRICSDQTNKEMIHTLIHEAMHALSDRTGIRQAIDSGVEEILAENVATMITENFKITPK